MSMDKKSIVILGAGFGGLRAALKIGRSLKRFKLQDKYQILLIDRNDHHTYTPLLYEVATTSKETANLYELHSLATHSVSEIVANLPVNFIRAEVDSLDLAGGSVRLKGGENITYEYLIFALGSETNYFNVPGLKENALPLKTFQDAIQVRDRIWNLSMTGKTPLRIIIGGAGSTGIELAGELKAWSGELVKELLHSKLEVTLVEGAPTILPGFDSRIVSSAEKRLKKLGIETITKETISSITADELTLGSGKKVSFDVFIWTGGVKGSSVLTNMPLKTEARGRVEVMSEMECLPQSPDLKVHSKIYGLGDNICVYDPKTQKPMPGVARAAIIQGSVVAHNILEIIKFKEGLSDESRFIAYKPESYPYIIPIGGKYAVAKIGPFVISGFLGWVLKGLVELNYLISIMPFQKALSVWFQGLKVFIQNDRLG